MTLMVKKDLSHTPSESLLLESPIQSYLDALYQQLLDDDRGRVADYIPKLADAPRDGFSIVIATIDGVIYQAGAARSEFTIQSMSKPFMYGMALESLGRDQVLARVGVEPTGEAFNAIVLDDEHNRPYNPMVNAGAIAVANLLMGTRNAMAPEVLLSRFAGRALSVDEEVFQSEDETGHRNRAIAYMMLNSGMIDGEPESVLDYYFRQCSVRVNCVDVALMAATFANRGRNPKTGDAVISPSHVRDLLTLMSMCGMYDYAGQWAFDIGVPAKSGVSGGIFAVVPGQAGISVWSPPLDEVGHSVRGVEVCKALSADFGFHGFAEKPQVGSVIHRHYTADSYGSRRGRSHEEDAWLRPAAQRVHVVELQGVLVFGGTEKVVRHLLDVANASDAIIVDCARVDHVDDASIDLLVQILGAYQRAGGQVSLSGLKADETLASFPRAMSEAGTAVSLFTDVDAALEAAESRLLDGRFQFSAGTTEDLAQFDVFRGLDKDACIALQGVLCERVYESGECIVRSGEIGDGLYIMLSGAATVSVELEDGTRARLVTAGPGFTFGETALVDAHVRKTQVMATGPVACLFLSTAEFERLRDLEPRISMVIYANLVRSLSHRLGRAQQELGLLVG